MKFAVLLFALAVGAPALGQTETPPPLVPAEGPEIPPPPPVPPPAADVGPPQKPEDVSAWRLHFSAGFGFVADDGSSANPVSGNLGFLLTVGKPLYEAERHRIYQWVTDTALLVGYSPQNRTALVVMTPTFGTNFYFGPVFGLEWRGGAGFGATPGTNTNLGLSLLIEGAVTLRLFSDDRMRLKFEGQSMVLVGFLAGGVSYSTADFAIGFELPL